MFLARSPLRISLGGGGTDLPSYYRIKEGFLLCAAINQYVYCNVTKPFEKGIYLKYSEIEKTNNKANIKHKIIKEVLYKYPDISNQIEITTLADIPAGTGLGSSGSFTCSLLKAIHALKRNYVSNEMLAKEACNIEIDRLKQPIGKQDQYASALGGVRILNFKSDDTVESRLLNLDQSDLEEFKDHLLLYFTGYTRSATSLLDDQDKKTRENESEMIKNLDHVKDLGKLSVDLLESKDYMQFGLVMHDHWQYKKSRTKGMTNSEVDEIYQYAIENGAVGGKLVGAGGGGFLLFVTPNKAKLRNAMKVKSLREVPFNFDHEGTKLIVSE